MSLLTTAPNVPKLGSIKSALQWKSSLRQGAETAEVGRLCARQTAFSAPISGRLVALCDNIYGYRGNDPGCRTGAAADGARR
jgi:hypothetical protein